MYFVTQTLIRTCASFTILTKLINLKVHLPGTRDIRVEEMGKGEKRGQKFNPTSYLMPKSCIKCRIGVFT